eukprot:gene11188-17205_t
MLAPALRAFVPLLLAGAAAAAGAPDAAPNEYLVYFRDGVGTELIEALFPETSADPAVRASSSNRGFGAVRKVVGGRQTSVLLHIEPAGVALLQAAYPNIVKGVSPNYYVRGASLPSFNCPSKAAGADAPWHLKRMYQTSSVIGDHVRFDPDWGDGVDVLILDSGVNCSHAEFTPGLCTWWYNSVRTEGSEDLHGHGTAVASVLVGSTLGFAKKAHVHVFKCLNVNKAGAVADCVETLNAMLEWMNHNKTKTTTTVINLSLEVTGASMAVTQFRQATEDLATAGAIVVTAAGNLMSTSCTTLPGVADGTINVGGTGLSAADGDYVVSYSNQGHCIDIFAPGMYVKVADAKSTSFASPGVAGMVAAYISTEASGQVTRAQVLSWLTKNAQSGLAGLKAGTYDNIYSPDRMAHLPCPEVDEAHGPHLYQENCFGVFVDTVGGSGQISYAADGEATAASDYSCFAIDCPSSEISMGITRWELEPYRNTDVVNFYRSDGTLVLSQSGAKDKLQDIPVVSNYTVVLFSSVNRYFVDATYNGFTLDFTCASTVPTTFIKLVAEATEGNGAFDVDVEVIFVFTDATNWSAGVYTAANASDAVVWEIPEGPQGHAQLLEIQLVPLNSSADDWSLTSFEVYDEGAGWQQWLVGSVA